MDALDRAIAGFDAALRTIAGVHRIERASPASGFEESALSAAERQHAAALMRVITSAKCAPKRYTKGQALTARDPGRELRSSRRLARRKITSPGAQTGCGSSAGTLSVLNPVWYAGSLRWGSSAGRSATAGTSLSRRDRAPGRRASCGTSGAAPGRRFAHSSGGRANARGGSEAPGYGNCTGCGEMPAPVRLAMRAVAKVMTTVAYRV
jgi:ubiquinone biosynthesis monooxygenase Coq7